jgi:hypothetical protein
LLAKPDKIKAYEQCQQGNHKETGKTQDEVPFQKKTDTKKANPCLENNYNDDAKSKEKWLF